MIPQSSGCTLATFIFNVYFVKYTHKKAVFKKSKHSLIKKGTFFVLSTGFVQQYWNYLNIKMLLFSFPATLNSLPLSWRGKKQTANIFFIISDLVSV